MFYVDEVHADEEYRADVALVSKDELTLAERLINSLRADFEPGKYRDQYRGRLESLIAGKIPDKVEQSPSGKKRGQVVSITDALRQSLSQLKKKPENKPLQPSNPTVRRGKTT
jgi:DNA end-binding protein Ku